MQELEQLRQATQALKQDVDLLRANQEKQRLQEESLVLTQLRKTVQALQAEGSAIDDQKLAGGSHTHVGEGLTPMHTQQNPQVSTKTLQLAVLSTCTDTAHKHCVRC